MGLLPVINAPDVLLFNCPLCPFHTYLLNQLESHFNDEHDRQIVDFFIYQCSKCQKITSSKQILLEHIQIYHHHDLEDQESKVKPSSSPKQQLTTDEVIIDSKGVKIDMDSKIQNCHMTMVNGDEHLSNLDKTDQTMDDDDDDSLHQEDRFKENIKKLKNDTDHFHHQLDKNENVVYLKTLFAGQLYGMGASSIASNKSNMFGMEHQCLFCHYSNANRKQLAMHYAKHGIKQLDLAFVNDDDANGLDLHSIQSDPVAAMDELIKVS